MEDERIDSQDTSPAAVSETEQSGSADAGQLQKERDDYYDRLLRKTAEFDNYRKRTERERLQLSEAAAADLLTELLPLVDDLERALNADAATPAAGGIRKGVELIHKQLVDVLRKRGVRPIEALGADFDPHF